jgi:hypothetical protein
MILNVLVEKLKRRSKDDFKGRRYEATLILQGCCHVNSDLTATV